MRRKSENHLYKVAVILTGNAEAADKIISGIKPKNAVVKFVADPQIVLPVEAESVYVIELGLRDRLFSGVFAAGAVRLKITETAYNVSSEIEEIVKSFRESDIRVSAESTEEETIVTYAYYDEVTAEKFLMRLSGVLALADARVETLCAYDPPVADEKTLFVAAEGFNGTIDSSEPDFGFRGYLGAGEKIKLVMEKDVSSGTEETEKLIRKLLSKENIKWRNVKA